MSVRNPTVGDLVLGRLLRAAAERHGGRTLLQFGALTRSFDDVDSVTNSVANGLAALGVERGSKVAIMAPNGPAFIDAWLGAIKLGAIYVPINPTFLQRLDAVLNGVPKLRHVVLTASDPGRPRLLNGDVEISALADLIQAPDRAPAVDISRSDPMAISFTSGTTGPSKGVLASHSHVITFAMDWIRATGFKERQSIYTCMPLFHAIAAWLGVVPAVIMGGRIAIVPRFSASTFWDDVRRYQADVAHGIFSMVPILLKQPPRPEDADQPARVFYFAQQNDAFEERFNCRIIEVYGATETGIVTATPHGGVRRKGSCGKPNLGTFDVMLANDRDQPVGIG